MSVTAALAVIQHLVEEARVASVRAYRQAARSDAAELVRARLHKEI